MIKENGMSGGYAFVLIDGPTGGIFSIMNNSNPKNWNLAVSVRALRLLTHGYVSTRTWITETFHAMGCELVDHSVRRIDFAVDVLAPSFDLHMDNFVPPSQSKVMPYWSAEKLLDDDGNRATAVVRGRRFESVTIGKMPGRQITVYDKTKACIDQKQPYWFEAWGIDKNDPMSKVFRVEVRAGRDAMAKRLLKRSFEAVESDIQNFIQKALKDIRYVTDKDRHKNITRAPNHQIWNIAQAAALEIPFDPKPIIHETRALEIMRLQRLDMATKQGFGNLLNALILEGHSAANIATNFETQIQTLSNDYSIQQGPGKIREKAENIKARLGPLLRQGTDDTKTTNVGIEPNSGH